MTDEQRLFKLFNEAYAGHYTKVVRALEDEDISSDNLARYIRYTIVMINKLDKMAVALDGPTERIMGATERIEYMQSTLKKRMRSKYSGNV
ncbi:hypothetical protein AXI71_gp23 [Lactococcus phage GE1]|uniref:Uncharacterized protein n=1 Tax=Lactococcus phage GE1 TaxID=1698369 RepID=A0A0N9BAV4_9CAUD|nr:hypothetical protein AXI71_gp23 [Lactococcus phage GE1]ALA06977.1 hypothetical protein [Lactococcus phage GE1]